MKFRYVIAAMCLTSSLAFADELPPVAPAVPSPSPTATPYPIGFNEIFTCRFHGDEGKDEVRCVVSARACLPIGPVQSAPEVAIPSAVPTDTPELRFCKHSEIIVECTNGFSLHDSRADAKIWRDNIIVKAHDDDHEALLKIFEVLPSAPTMSEDRRSRKYEAELELQNLADVELKGRCTQLERVIFPTMHGE